MIFLFLCLGLPFEGMNSSACLYPLYYSALSYMCLLKIPINSTTHSINQCNCKIKNTCPLLGKCLYKNVVYKITVKQYIGATEGTIKQRIYNHKLSLTNRNYSSNTSLSSYIWHLKDMSISPTITWEILKLATAYNKT